MGRNYLRPGCRDIIHLLVFSVRPRIRAIYDLQQVPGIGPSTAQKILDTRKSYGAFKSVDDLLSIKGIGPRKLGKMRNYLTVGKPSSKKQSTAPQTAAAPTNPLPAKSPAKQPGTPSPTASEDEEP